MDQAELGQRLVDDAVLAQDRQPGDHANDVRGPERHRAEQKQSDLPEHAADVEDQEIGYVEADHQRQGPDDGGELERLGVLLQRDAGGEDVAIVVHDERLDDLRILVVEEADGDHHQHRQHEEEQQDQRRRADLQPGGEGWRQLHRFPRSVVAKGGAGCAAAARLSVGIRRRRTRSSAW